MLNADDMFSFFSTLHRDGYSRRKSCSVHVHCLLGAALLRILSNPDGFSVKFDLFGCCADFKIYLEAAPSYDIPDGLRSLSGSFPKVLNAIQSPYFRALEANSHDGVRP